MGERPTLILTTRLGVRPLGVRGDALHNVAGQLLAVIRRRLGDGAANLLAEPQLREGGDGIDWYAARSGEVRRFADLSASERAATLETVETRLAAIRSLGAVLRESTGSEEARLIGRSLELATARPSDDFIFLVDGEPVIAATERQADAIGDYPQRRAVLNRQHRLPSKVEKPRLDAHDDRAWIGKRDRLVGKDKTA